MFTVILIDADSEINSDKLKMMQQGHIFIVST